MSESVFISVLLFLKEIRQRRTAWGPTARRSSI